MLTTTEVSLGKELRLLGAGNEYKLGMKRISEEKIKITEQWSAGL